MNAAGSSAEALLAGAGRGSLAQRGWWTQGTRVSPSPSLAPSCQRLLPAVADAVLLRSGRRPRTLTASPSTARKIGVRTVAKAAAKRTAKGVIRTWAGEGAASKSGAGSQASSGRQIGAWAQTNG